MQGSGSRRHLILDQVLQLTSTDEYIYHEMLVHVAVATVRAHRFDGIVAQAEKHPATESPPFAGDNKEGALVAFVLGGGDGGVTSRLLLHPEVTKVIQWEIDVGVVQAAQAFFPELAGVYDDGRVDLRIGDGIAYIESGACLADAPFDVAVIDTTDTPLQSRFSAAFYRSLAACMSPDAVVTQNVQSLGKTDTLTQMFAYHHAAFQHVHPYTIATPDYVSPYILFMSTRTHSCPSGVPDLLVRTEYYSKAVHRAAFALPAALVRTLRAHGWTNECSAEECSLQVENE
jgi:spermidine synthase